MKVMTTAAECRNKKEIQLFEGRKKCFMRYILVLRIWLDLNDFEIMAKCSAGCQWSYIVSQCSA